jgi:hypothetical protein
LKTIVVALDGFDLRYCPKKYLDKITQVQYGIYDISFLEKSYTPICFSALLTGKDPRCFGYTGDFISGKYQSGFINWMKPLFWIRRNLFGWIKSFSVHKTLVKRNIIVLDKVDRNMTEDMKKFTIFNELKRLGYKIYPINVPSFNEDLFFRKKMGKLYNASFIERKKELKNMISIVRKRWFKVFENIKENDLIFFYSNLPDEAHHLLKNILNFSEILKPTYESLCELPFLFEMKDIAILILSDHGYNHSFNEKGLDVDGGHSKTGFWSVNRETIIKPKTIFDFYDLIYELVVTK